MGSCAVIVVSHDRWLLDTVCERTWEVDRGQVHSAEGGYSAYVLAQAERERGEEAAERRRRNLARKELAWLQRGARARTTKAKFRVEAANALIAAEPPARDSVELTRLATARLGKTVIELEDVSVAVRADAGLRPLLEHVTWQLGPGDRVGVAGVNGSGKTSLLNLLAGTPGPGLVAEGTIVRGKTVRLAHLSQELAELDPDRRVREAVEEIRLRIRVGDRELSAGQLLERLGFSAERQWTRIGDLSGGERRRVQMLRLLMDEPNVLLLDEPTNDLDIETLTEFEDLLDGWPGTLVVVSHDRYFLERITEHVVALLGGGRLSFLAGGVDEYLDRIRTARAGSTGGPQPAPAAPGPPRSSAAEERTARKELQRLERQLDRLTVRETELTELLAANATDYEKLTALGAELRAVQSEKSDLEDRWLAMAAGLEAYASRAPAAPGPREPKGAGAAWTVFSPQTHPRRDEGATREGGASEGGWGGGWGPEASGKAGRPGGERDKQSERDYTASKGASRIRIRSARCWRSPRSRPASSARSRPSRSARAASARATPCSVSVTRTPRLSLGSGSRRTRPAAASRSIRLVMVPEVTRVARSSAPGVSWNGGPCRRSAESTSNSHVSRPWSANAPRRAMSRCRASREIRLSTCIGSTSRSGRCTRHAATRSSTSSSSTGTWRIPASESSVLPGGTPLSPGGTPSPRTPLADPPARGMPGAARWAITRAYLLTSRGHSMYKGPTGICLSVIREGLEPPCGMRPSICGLEASAPGRSSTCSPGSELSCPSTWSTWAVARGT